MKVSIIITAHNYGRFLRQCLDSALNQNFDSLYEIVVVNDGSTDDTEAILEEYAGRIKVINLPGLGLPAACNRGIEVSKGEYIIRLDADDYFDPNILHIEANILDMHPEIGMVYGDYFIVDQTGEVLELVRLLKPYDETSSLDRNPLAAAAMFRRSYYEVIGGYDETLKHQEDYDFWTRFTSQFKVHKVDLPLMYYRRHDLNMSSKQVLRTKAKQFVNRKLTEPHNTNIKTLGFIPARAASRFGGKLAIRELAGRPLIAHTITEAFKVPLFDRVIVSTDDEEIAQVSREYGAEVPFLRPDALTGFDVPIEAVVSQALQHLDANENYSPDLIAILHVISPLKKAEHMSEAINTLLLYQLDSVISVVKDLTFHWHPGAHGLMPVVYRKRLLKDEKDIVYKENGAIYVVRSENVESNLLGEKVGYIDMLPEESVHLDSEFEFWLAEQILLSHRRLSHRGIEVANGLPADAVRHPPVQ